jgi:tripartite motif-containing protein 71
MRLSMLKLCKNYSRPKFDKLIKNLLMVSGFAILLLVPNIVLGQNEYSYVKKWGSQGSGEGQFTRPSTLAADFSGNFSTDNIYVIDSGNSRIVKFANNGTFLAKWGSQGAGDGQFSLPSGIAVDPIGNVYVNDWGNNRIQKFDSLGTFITSWQKSAFMAPPSEIKLPSGLQPGIAIDPSGNVYVAFTDTHEIVKYTPDGKELTRWGDNGIGNGQFSFPSSVATDLTGNVYVLDSGNSRIQKFDSEGTFLGKWGSQGAGNNQFSRPLSVAVDSTGSVYVLNSGNSIIQKFAEDGSFTTSWGSRGASDGQMTNPSGITTDSAGNVYIADTGNNRIQVFAPIPPT